MAEKQKSFWVTFPGILTGVAGILTGIGGLLLALNQLGVLGSRDEKIPILERWRNDAFVELPEQMWDEITGMWKKNKQINNASDEVVAGIVYPWIIGAFPGHIVRHGEDHKTYRTPKLYPNEMEFTATPSAAYFDQQGRKLRTLRTASRRSGEDWTVSDETYIWKEGDWTKL